MSPRRLFIHFWLLLCVSSALFAAEPMTWPRFDGPEQNRVSRERRIDLAWGDAQPASAETPELVPVAAADSDRPELWRIEGLPGDRTPLVFNDKLYLLRHETSSSADSETENNSAPQQYAIDCWIVSGRDQQARFRYRLPVRETSQLPLPQLTGDPWWRQLFCITGSGQLIALDSDLGSELWTVDLPELLGRAAAPDHVTAPLIFEHLTIVSLQWTGESNESTADTDPTASVLVAVDRRNGQLHWVQQTTGAQAATAPLPHPVLCVTGQQIAVASQLSPGQVQLSQVRTGQAITQLSLGNESAVAAEILCESGRLAILESVASAPNPPEWSLSCFQLPSAQQPTGKPELITRSELGQHDQATALLKGPSLFAATSSGLLRQISLADDSQDGAADRDLPLSSVGKHDLLWIDEQLLITGESGHWQVFKFAKPADGQSLPSLEAFYVELWDAPLPGPPVIAKQRVYVRYENHLVSLGEFDGQKAVSDLLVSYPHQAGEDEREATETTQILLVPAIQDLRPGFEIPYQVLGFSSSGQFTELIPTTDVEWIWEGPGQLDSMTGLLAAPDQVEALQSQPLNVRWKQLEADATVRLLPGKTPEFDVLLE